MENRTQSVLESFHAFAQPHNWCSTSKRLKRSLGFSGNCKECAISHCSHDFGSFSFIFFCWLTMIVSKFPIDVCVKVNVNSIKRAKKKKTTSTAIGKRALSRIILKHIFDRLRFTIGYVSLRRCPFSDKLTCKIRYLSLFVRHLWALSVFYFAAQRKN